jgi:hypothetical protein
MYKWSVKFTTPQSGGRMLSETVEAPQWSYAKILMESKYAGIKILNYTPIK